MALGATQRRLGGHGERTIVLRRSLVRPFVRSFVRTLHGLCRAVAAASFDGLANRARQSPPLRQPRTRFAHSNAAAAAAAAVSTDNVCVCVCVCFATHSLQAKICVVGRPLVLRRAATLLAAIRVSPCLWLSSEKATRSAAVSWWIIFPTGNIKSTIDLFIIQYYRTTTETLGSKTIIYTPQKPHTLSSSWGAEGELA